MRAPPEYNFFDDKEFEEKYRNRLDILNDVDKIPFTPVGNPLVDNPIYAIGVIAKKDKIFELTLQDAISAFMCINGNNSYGNEFSLRNYRTSSFTMVFGVNNPLVAPGLGKLIGKKVKDPAYTKASKVLPSFIQIRLYRAFMLEFLINYYLDMTENCSTENNCVSCGLKTDFNFNKLQTKFYFLRTNKEKKFASGATREWFPLIGSISAIQAFSGYSESNVVCGKCLFSVQFLPQISNLFEGKLVVYQSNNTNFTKSIISRNMDQFEDLLQGDPEKKIENIGKKESHVYVTLGLLDILSVMKRTEKLNLTMFNFTNSGTDPFARIITLPSQTLMFLHEMVNEVNVRNELERFIKIEKKILKYQDKYFINSMISRNDYQLFYQRTYKKDYQLPSPKFYHFYQKNIRNWSDNALLLVQEICKISKSKIEEDKIIRVLKSDVQIDLMNMIIPIILEMLSANNDHLNGVLDLFATKYKEVPSRNPWTLFKFYLHPEYNHKTDYEIVSFGENNFKNIFNENILQEIKRFAYLLIQYESRRQSFDLDKYLKTMHNLTKFDLMQKYIMIAREKPGFTYHKIASLLNSLYFNEFQFFLRVFSTINQNIELEYVSIGMEELISESGLNNQIIDALLNYIDIRSDRISTRRIFRELEYDLRNGDYSADNFYILLNDKIEIKNIELNKQNTLDLLSENSYFQNGRSGDSFSWLLMRNKIRLFLIQYKLILDQEPRTLVQQIKEV